MGVSEHLRACGFTAIEASSADEARILFTTGAPISAVFSDVNMPGVDDGIELASWIELRYPDVKLVLTSGIAGAHRAAAEACANVHAFLTKPYDYLEVGALMRELSGRAGARAGD